MVECFFIKINFTYIIIGVYTWQHPEAQRINNQDFRNLLSNRLGVNLSSDDAATVLNILSRSRRQDRRQGRR